MRSDKIKKGDVRAPHRALLKGLGLTDHELQGPLVGIASAWNEIIPGHLHLTQIAEAVKAGIRQAGATPMTFSTIGICDGIAMGHEGMKFSLPTRELIADSIAAVALAMPFDGLVFISNCDKITPGMMMAMGELNLPSILVCGGPMLAGRYKEEAVDIVSVFEAVGRRKRGTISQKEFEELEECACPGVGSCAGLFTANSMNALSEAMGVSLKGNGTIPAVVAERLRLAKYSGMRVVELINSNIKPRDIVNLASFKNAITVDLALGGSTNTVLHLLAIAKSFGIELPIALFDEISRVTPHLCNLSPIGNHHIQDLHYAGGVHAVMNRLLNNNLLHTDVKTVSHFPFEKEVKKTMVLNDQVIRPFMNPFHNEGGLAVLYGNLAPKSAVVKQAGMPDKLRKHSGPAVVFDCEEEATKEILAGNINKGDVIVIRYEGPKGGPGMREMLSPTSALVGMDLITEVVLLTDGRFSGGSIGAVIGHMSPEAAEGGLLAIIENGDIIELDIDKRQVNLKLDKRVIEHRVNSLLPAATKIENRFLYRYSQLVQSAHTGAVFTEEICQKEF